MAEQDQDILLGRLAVHYKFLTKDRAKEAIRLWRATQAGNDLGEFLVSESYIAPDALPKLVRARTKYLQRSEAKAKGEETAAEPAAPEPEPAANPLDAAVGAATVRLTPDMVNAAMAGPPEATSAEDPQPAETLLIETKTFAAEIEELTQEAASDLTSPVAAEELSPAEEMADEVLLIPEPDAEPEVAEVLSVEPLPAAPLPAAPLPAAPLAAEDVILEPVVAEPVVAEPVVAEPVVAEPVVTEPAADDLEETRPMAAAEPESPEPAAAEPESPEPDAAASAEAGILGYRPGDDLVALLRRAAELKASDLHVHSGAPLKIRLHGELRDASQTIDRDTAKELVYGILTDEQRAWLEEHLQLDFSFAVPGVGRFRSNTYFQHRGLDGVFRVIPPEPPTLEELGLPGDLRRFSEYHQGIVLFTGPAGCGKSSTMAALVAMINESRPDHILTIEDPIEYVHQPQSCVVNQREVGPHTESFARALRAALREDPDIIVIGELRDLETISLALTAAETGHLVLGTLHTASTIPTLNRLVGVFPPDQQAQIRTMVSESLRVIVSQRLVPRADGNGRVAALEILINNKAIGNLIRENRTFQVKSVLQTGGTQGMCELDASLADLVKEGTITQEMARREALDPKRFA